MFKTSGPQQTFFGNLIYDQVIPPNHFLKQLAACVDFSFINEAVTDCYDHPSEAGRPGWEPQRLFKVLFLAYLDNLSERQIEESVNLNLAHKWFVGLDVHEKGPDHSTLSLFRDRLGAERFQQLFNRIVEMAREKKFITDRLHIIDSTHTLAKVNLFRLKEEHEKENPEHYVNEHSPDPDARFGRKSKKKGFYGYKDHLALDQDSQMITDLEVTPGNESDSKHLLLDQTAPPDEVTADKAYDTEDNHQQLSDQKIQDHILLKKNRSNYSKEQNKKWSAIRSLIESKNSELKNHHGLGRCRYLGLDKTKIQAFLTAIVVNLKRFVKFAQGISSPPNLSTGVLCPVA